MSTKQKKFLILSQTRSGSTYLMKLLDSHPDICCEGELLNLRIDHWMNVQSPRLRSLMKKPPIRTILRRMPRPYIELRRRLADKKAFGFKVFLAHLFWPAHSVRSFSRHGWKIIHLLREDALEQSLSMLVANSTGHWHRLEGGDDGNVDSIQIDPQVVVKEVERRHQLVAKEQQLLIGVDHFRVSYENQLSNKDNREAMLIGLQKFIGVPVSPLSTDLAKTYRKKYSEIVGNYSEIEAAVKQATSTERTQLTGE